MTRAGVMMAKRTLCALDRSTLMPQLFHQHGRLLVGADPPGLGHIHQLPPLEAGEVAYADAVAVRHGGRWLAALGVNI